MIEKSLKFKVLACGLLDVLLGSSGDYLKQKVSLLLTSN